MQNAPYSRIRFREDLVSHSYSGMDQGLNSSFPNVVWDLSSQTSKGGVNEVVSDVVTPGWIKERSSGKIVNNPCSITRRNVVYSNSDHHFVATHPSYAAYSYPEVFHNGAYLAHIDYFDASDPIVPNIRNDSVAPVDLNEEKFIKLAAIKARTGISPILVQSLVSAAELPKTLSLIASSLSTIRQIRKSVVTGNPDFALRAIGNQRRGRVKVNADFSRQTAANRWLEFRYGWTPLVFEIQGAIKALNNARVVKPIRATSRGFERSSGENSALVVWNRSQRGLWNFRYTRKKTLSVRAYVLYTADLKHQQARDFGVTELPLAMWELVPYSFVVDWFVNIGNWIEALTPKLGINILAEGYTIKTTNFLSRKLESWTKVITGSNQSWDMSGSIIGSEDTRLDESYRRVPHLDVLYSPPPLNVRLDKKRVLDAIALISGKR